MDQAIAGAASAIFFNQGQTCCAGSRLFAHESVFDQVVEGMNRAADKIKMGPGLDPATEMGPLVSEEQFNRVNGYIKSGRDPGARIGSGGSRFSDRGYFVQPTVISDVRPDMKVVAEEIFGPVVVAQSFASDSDLDKLAAQANDTPFGLAASIWTKDLSAAHKMARRIKAGTIWINCHNVFDAALPFGGYKQSGWGREMGAEVLNNYTEVKAVTIKL
jgi:phenylacetaldehyde dehydrogenase